MKINTFCNTGDQFSSLGKHQWSVSRLIDLSKELEIFEIPMNHLYVYYKYDMLTLREMVTHMKAVLESDLSYPIILDEDGEVMDGRHRIMKAMLEGAKTIKAVKFETNPLPCRVNE